MFDGVCGHARVCVLVGCSLAQMRHRKQIDSHQTEERDEKDSQHTDMSLYIMSACSAIILPFYNGKILFFFASVESILILFIPAHFLCVITSLYYSDQFSYVDKPWTQNRSSACGKWSLWAFHFCVSGVRVGE